MNSTFTEEDYQLIEQNFSGLRDSSRKRCANRQEYETVLKAFDFANDAHKNVRRRSGDPYILHPIAVAKIVVDEIGLGYKSISAALLHDVVEDTDFTVDDIRRNFGDKIASLVDGLTKIKTALDGSKDTTSLQAENFKRILITLNDDVRIVLIKLADRLHNVRTIEFMPEYKRDKILSETMYIFAPLAHRLGLYAIKSEMENIWLKYREPDAYKDIESRLENIASQRAGEMEGFTETIRQELENAGYGNSRILKRLKTPYSIWKKMNTKNLPFEEIYDLYAIRIIFQPKEGITEREQCWHIFTRITAIYPYKADRTRDWTKEPKSNGYEALHLTVMSPGGNWVEIQIRSERMDSIAERGVAAHWLYKKSGEGNGQEASDFEVDNWLKKVREIIENPDANAIQFLDDFHKELTTADIFVFTPKGETRRLEKGATVLDFAYSIHTDIGNKAIAGKVNQKLVPLSQVLHSGDQVEIISSSTGSPKREWLDFLKTAKARSVVMESLKKSTKDSIGEGFRILDSRLNERGISERIKVMKRLLAYYQCDTKDQFYAKIGLGVITLDDLDKALRSSAPASEGFWGINKLFRPKSSGKDIDRKKQFIIGEGSGNTNYIIADCCSPVPGDSVMGIIDEQGRVVVHKKSCDTANDIASKHGEKVIAVRWSEQSVSKFLTKVAIRGLDRAGLLNDLTKVISGDMAMNMRRIVFEAHDGVFEGTIELYVQGKDEIENLVRRLSSVRGLDSVNRVDINQ